jgi:hypothetical protein
MTANRRNLIGGFLLVVVSIVGLDAAYWLLFYLWRTAADPSRKSLWLTRIYLWAAISTLAIAGWGILVLWMFREKENRHRLND